MQLDLNFTVYALLFLQCKMIKKRESELEEKD